MNKVLKHSLAAAGLGLALLGAGASFAGPHGGMHGSPERMMERMAEHLDLSDEQQAEVQQILRDSREQGEADRERLMALKSSLRDSADTFDSGEVQAAVDEIGQITSRMTYRMAEAQHKVRAVLNEEQRAQLDAWAQQREERRGKWHRGRGPDGAPEE
ncbi:Spy/CpxP family protein refolding chaperone [Parahaliea mediterranea]|uniref:Signaling pathway modulator ZraP n=1 Tax=Parahaliea mediterranea TaxID=651086 RepID=A0A939DF18_9GAMM|nr:Spy/CpxP family protein refolding chaperone [Parahaliea mediterranea]MBN7796691.1 Spy/CpxP family protein refolding chaperone [Parahaliea mediterranea]